MRDVPAEKPTSVTGTEAKRLKREALGIADSSRPTSRRAAQRSPKEAGARDRVYRYRFYPTEAQAEQLAKTFGACRWVYNEGLALRARAWREHRVSVGFAGARYGDVRADGFQLAGGRRAAGYGGREAGAAE
ncbi:helix-turn-helix domain-containing protein [Streptomyces sp. VRA16 Mangrove soil]|uniref:helix-turn-helix domain-containing protein n=1 Tax=Streptomyces sp. VRA16 Mangrove soil TaxID=2817434 RepID=UPI001E597A4E|nr:helix-turn-helix domain-containing protein [Streptomyces sp. VRA16 Mangrove soil]